MTCSRVWTFRNTWKWLDRTANMSESSTTRNATTRIVLTKDDPKAGGHRHLISIDWVEYVDRKVHLNKPSQKAMSEWQTAA